VWVTVHRSTAAPASSMTQTACSDHDQSTPAHLSGPPPVLSLLVMVGFDSFTGVAPAARAGVPGRAQLPVGH
jgi:hypothetical protein